MTELRKGQVRLGPRTWAVIREAYLGGASGASLAEAYGCSLGTIRYRAVREGWRRCDVADAGEPAAPDAADIEPPTLAALAEAARLASMKAVRAGRPLDAAAYMRVVEAVRRLKLEEDEALKEEEGVVLTREAEMKDVEAELQRRLACQSPERRARTLAAIRERLPGYQYTRPP